MIGNGLNFEQTTTTATTTTTMTPQTKIHSTTTTPKPNNDNWSIFEFLKNVIKLGWNVPNDNKTQSWDSTIDGNTRNK